MFTADEAQVLQEIDSRRSELARTLRDLLRFKTITPAMGESPWGDDSVRLQAHVSRALRDLAFDTETWEIDPAALPTFPGCGVVPDRDLRGMPVVVGRRPGEGRSLLLNAHYDVVPPGVAENWSVPPFEGAIQGGAVFGRGAADMKGGFAALLFALRVIADRRVELPGALIFESVPDEEQTRMGTLSCCARGLRADAGLIPEPTDLNVLVATRGSFSGKVLVEGRAGHSEEAQPPWQEGVAVNAITKATKVLARLEALNAEWAADPKRRHRYLDPDILVPTMIRGGEWEVMYPERVEVTFTSDFGPATKDIRGEVQAALDDLAQEDSWLRAHPPVLRAPAWIYGGEVTEDEPIVRTSVAALADLGILARLKGSGSLTDMVHLVNYSHVPTVSVGPSTRTIHAPDEHVTIDDLVATTKALALILMRWSSASA